MRKLGFTLAEVLITLGIIGVIATLTLPTLMSNTAEREYSTALKKAVSALTEAVQMNVALENISFDEMLDSGTNTEQNSLYAFLCNRMQTEKFANAKANACDDSGDSSSGAGSACLGYGGAMESNNSAMFFRDGSAIIFNSTHAMGDSNTKDKCMDAEGKKVTCFRAIYDVNGTKKPNLVANCDGDKSKEIKATGTDCTAERKFVARDQYAIKLYGIGAYPNSPAAHYIFNRKQSVQI